MSSSDRINWSVVIEIKIIIPKFLPPASTFTSFSYKTIHSISLSDQQAGSETASLWLLDINQVSFIAICSISSGYEPKLLLCNNFTNSVSELSWIQQISGIVLKIPAQIVRHGSRASDCEWAEKAWEEADAYNHYLQRALWGLEVILGQPQGGHLQQLLVVQSEVKVWDSTSRRELYLQHLQPCQQASLTSYSRRHRLQCLMKTLYRNLHVL